MVVDTLDFLVRTMSIQIVVVPVLYPVINESQIISAFESTLAKSGAVRLCVFSHISSMVSTR